MKTDSLQVWEAAAEEAEEVKLSPLDDIDLIESLEEVVEAEAAFQHVLEVVVEASFQQDSIHIEPEVAVADTSAAFESATVTSVVFVAAVCTDCMIASVEAVRTDYATAEEADFDASSYVVAGEEADSHIPHEQQSVAIAAVDADSVTVCCKKHAVVDLAAIEAAGNYCSQEQKHTA